MPHGLSLAAGVKRRPHINSERVRPCRREFFVAPVCLVVDSKICAGRQSHSTSANMPDPNEKIERIDVAEEMSKSFLDYSMSVIISRALPDARDGLKPSQRAHSLRDERSVAVPGTAAQEVRQDLRRHQRQLPPAWRGGHLSERSSTWPNRGRCATG